MYNMSTRNDQVNFVADVATSRGGKGFSTYIVGLFVEGRPGSPRTPANNKPTQIVLAF